MNSFIQVVLLFVVLTFATIAAADDEMAPGAMAAIFRLYDTEADEEPECQPDYVDDKICPKEKSLPCAPIPQIKDYCKELLGPEITKQMEGVELEKGLNAIEGCVKYVGYHILDADHMACCPSEHCEDWLENMFSNLDYYDDDVDDDADYYEKEL